jgi:polyhydroxyalkanoate synthase subunit PhaC
VDGVVDGAVDAAANGFDLFLGDGPADLTPTPSSIVEEGPQRLIRRYRSPRRPRRDRAPVLLVPPLAAPANCFDLRRGCSLAEHLTGLGYPTYLVDYGPISFSDRALGLEHWVDEVIPAAVRAVSSDQRGAAVQPVGWCLGGIMTLLAAAADRSLPLASIAMVASPFDFAQVRMMAPVRRLSQLTGGALGTALYRMLGGAPAPLVSLGFRLTAIDRYLTRPLFLARNLGDRGTLAHAQAVDRYMASMLAYPGRTFGQLYHAFFRVNDLADGRIALDRRRDIDLAEVREPVLSVAGTNDVLAPEAAVRHVADLLPNASEVTLETAPGGHLGVLTGRSALDSTWSHLDRFLAAHDPGRGLSLARPRARRSAAVRAG